MELTLLGTAGPEGLPLPGCPCATCATAIGDRARAATSVLVDSTLLLDLTPGVSVAAARAGRTLDRVTHVLLSHPHDGPPVEVPAGLPSPTRSPDGHEGVLGTHRVRAVAVDSPGSGYEIADSDGHRILYLPPGAARAGGEAPQLPYDIVMLDVLGRPEALARLRATGAVDATTDVLAVHIDHTAPPEPELHRRLAALGARALRDAGTLSTTDRGPRVPAVPRRTLVLGGARSGKSVEAERRLAAFPGVVYVATAGTRDGDTEWAGRVSQHRERRPASWLTVETLDLEPLLAEDGPPLLIDCLSLWLTSVMDACDAWNDDTWNNGGEDELRKRVESLVAAWRATPRTVVAVSNEVGGGVVPATASGRRYRDELGRLNSAVARESEHVLLVVAGQALPLR
ncbi:bifunctional adenosylcobinamide kinase/adenosylcobinamide-phosphate guanylyltransferase [Wenjunlia tyrosinilytica]|uniref:Adenosylcobinamide kinase n=1 Tax=Wenjunlia tyrosinilytica TaxID=1544741 RepID=A0A917ZAP5_9ACTN|nr:bifunctional adenosylcobinamide kinase/adenosylcobinamide-phosphate guanylyltransferase [Wenjunlia tyrosinilytica]GGO79761.1 adenosylcobinamide kinase/adenosylcobinamide phosphate guanyltransferase [Wenjunlia tyrosinilytica]